MLFIPIAPGIYTPLLLNQERETQESLLNNSSNQSLFAISSYRNNVFLDLDTLDAKYKELLK
jgi:hypothetical protein